MDGLLFLAAMDGRGPAMVQKLSPNFTSLKPLKSAELKLRLVMSCVLHSSQPVTPLPLVVAPSESAIGVALKLKT